MSAVHLINLHTTDCHRSAGGDRNRAPWHATTIALKTKSLPMDIMLGSYNFPPTIYHGHGLIWVLGAATLAHTECGSTIRTTVV